MSNIIWPLTEILSVAKTGQGNIGICDKEIFATLVDIVITGKTTSQIKHI
jgi:hypothetical protein